MGKHRFGHFGFCSQCEAEVKHRGAKLCMSCRSSNADKGICIDCGGPKSKNRHVKRCMPCRSKNQRIDITKRFWSRVEKTDGCWIWTGYKTIWGYGQFWNQNRKSGQVEGMCVLHTCDNRLCVNPDHLFLGTMTDNMRDRDRKDRQAKGETSGAAKLITSEVLEIRRLLIQGTRRRWIADAFKVAPATIRSIELRETWKHLNPAP